MVKKEKPTGGLRERKKEKTKLTIQRTALRLFREQGYENTTIDQIADAAEISRASFFRYFPTKAEILFVDIIDTPLLESFHAQPADFNPIKALRIALHNTLREISPEDMEFEKQREELLYRIPDLQVALYTFGIRALPRLTGAIAERMDLAADDLRVCTLAGAVIGAIISIWAALPEGETNINEILAKRLDAGLEYLENEFPEIGDLKA